MMKPPYILLLVAVCLTQSILAASESALLLSDSKMNKIVKISMETGELEAEISDDSSAGSFTFDPVENEIYWYNVATEQIMKSDPNGNSISVVVNISATRYDRRQEFRRGADFQQGSRLPRVSGMALDPEARRLFYSVFDNHEINAVYLENGTEISVHNNTLASRNPGNIVLDTDNRRMYWSGGQTYQFNVYSSEYDGSDLVDLDIFSESSRPYELAFDPDNKVLYWVEYGRNVRSMTVTSSGGVGASGMGQGSEGNTILTEYIGEITSIAYSDDMLFVNNISYRGTHNQSLYSIPVDGGNQTYYNIDYTPNVVFIIPEDDSDPFRPDIYYELVHTGDETSELMFYCNFSHQADAVSYKTSWFVDGNLVTTTSSGQWDNGDVIMQHKLTETQMIAEGITNFGIQVTCSVEATFSADNKTTSPLSYQKFIGIQVTESPARLAEGESGEVQLTLTAPFGCGRNTPASQCKLTLDVLPNEVTTTCNAATLKPSACGVEFLASSWDTPVSLTVFAIITSTYGSVNTAVSINMKTVNFSYQTTWGGYTLTVSILVTKTSATIERKYCGSSNDPHLTTFDSRRYEHQWGGTFVLYRHKNGLVEVQIETFLCSPGRDGIYCNCGVWIRAGRTVFEINRCSTEEAYWNIDYLQCEQDSSDLIIKKRSNYLNYQIYLPTGGVVQVNGHGRFINIQVYPSQLDVNNTEGLCGLLSADGSCSDDFYLRNGSYSNDPTADGPCSTGSRTWRNELVSFSNNWRVPDNETLYNEEYLEDLKPWPKENIFCTCPEPTSGSGPASQPTCTADGSVDTCNTLPGFEDVPVSSCTVTRDRKRRRRRSISDGFDIPHIRNKRGGEVVPQWGGSWTEAAARAYCGDIFNNSTAIQTCDRIPGVETNEGIENCVMDIFYVDSTEFDVFSIDEVTTKCLHEAVVNPELKKIAPGSTESLYDVITREVCPSECSFKGTCTDGVCDCEPDYGGGDCSVDLTTPPSLMEVGIDGLCDTHTENCDVISAFGNTFVDGAMCRFEVLKLMAKGGIEAHSNRSGVEGSQLSVSHVRCQLPTSDTGSDEFVPAYRVSVANRGALYSNKLGLIVYDSRCISPFLNETDFQFSFKGSYCVHKGMCYEDKASHPSDNCKMCKGDENTWVEDSTCKSQFPVVGVVVGVVVGLVVLVVIAIVAIVCVKKRGKGSIDP